jgi:hypothetical protein
VTGIVRQNGEVIGTFAGMLMPTNVHGNGNVIIYLDRELIVNSGDRNGLLARLPNDAQVA